MADPKRKQVGFRLDVSLQGAFDKAVAMAAKEAPPGVNFTASDYLRGLFIRDLAARGISADVPAAEPANGAKPKARTR